MMLKDDKNPRPSSPYFSRLFAWLAWASIILGTLSLLLEVWPSYEYARFVAMPSMLTAVVISFGIVSIRPHWLKNPADSKANLPLILLIVLGFLIPIAFKGFPYVSILISNEANEEQVTIVRKTSTQQRRRSLPVCRHKLYVRGQGFEGDRVVCAREFDYQQLNISDAIGVEIQSNWAGARFESYSRIADSGTWATGIPHTPHYAGWAWLIGVAALTTIISLVSLGPKRD